MTWSNNYCFLKHATLLLSKAHKAKLDISIAFDAKHQMCFRVGRELLYPDMGYLRFQSVAKRIKAHIKFAKQRIAYEEILKLPKHALAHAVAHYMYLDGQFKELVFKEMKNRRMSP